MSTERQRESARINGAKSRGPVTPEGKAISAANSAHSTGPVTPEGKARVAKNAIRHGLLAKTIVLPDECPDGFKETLNGLRKEFKPRTWSERRAVEIAAQADWRRGRAWHVENVHLARAADAQDSPNLPPCAPP